MSSLRGWTMWTQRTGRPPDDDTILGIPVLPRASIYGGDRYRPTLMLSGLALPSIDMDAL